MPLRDIQAKDVPAGYITKELPPDANGVPRFAHFPPGTSIKVMSDAIKQAWPDLDPHGPQTKGINGIMRDIGEGLQKAPAEAGNAILNLPAQLFHSGVQIVAHPERAALNVAAGVGEGGEGILNLPSNLARYLQTKDINIPGEATVAKAHIPDLGIEKRMGLAQEQPGDSLLRGVGSFAPFMGIGKGVEGLSGVLERALGAGAASVAQQQNPLAGAFTSALGEGIPKGTSAAVRGTKDAFSVPKMIGSTLTPEEITANLKAAQGTNTPLGRVVGSPRLNNLFENTLATVPGSGQPDRLGKIRDQVNASADNLYSGLNPVGHDIDPNSLAEELLHNAYNKQQEIKNSLWNGVDAMAKEENHQLDLSKFQEAVKANRSALQKSPLLRNDPLFRSAIGKLGGMEIPAGGPLVDAKGQPLRSSTNGTDPDNVVSLLDAKLLKGNLYDEAQTLLHSTSGSDKAVGNMYKRLSKTLDTDIDNSVHNTGSPELQNAYDNANTHYQNNYVPFLDKNIHAYLSGKKSAQSVLQEMIKPGKSGDKYQDIQNFQALLPDDMKNLMGFGYLSKAVDNEGNLDPKQLTQLTNKLGTRQFKALFPDPATQQDIHNYNHLRGMNEDALNVLYNPKTGNRLAGTLSKIGLGMGAADTHSLTKAAAMLAAFSGGGRMATNWLTDPAVREKIANRIIDEKNNPKLPSKAEAKTHSLARSFINMRNLSVANQLGERGRDPMQ